MRGFLRFSGALLCAAVLGGPAAALNVRVLVATASQLTVRLPVQAGPVGPLAGGALPGKSTLPMAGWLVGVTDSGAGPHLTLNGQDSGNASLYLPPGAGSVVEIAGKTYRGGVQLRVQDGQVQGINVVDVEDYLRGVVAAEMPASWPSAALNAQAVIARTYVAARINPAIPYDTCATEACQMYVGIDGEKPSTDKAIQATRGQVVAFRGRAASTYFSSDSGGYTASSAEVWGNDLPYLVAKPDPFSVMSGSPRAKWRMQIPLPNVQAAATQYAPKIGTVQGVTITKTSPSGRPAEVTLTGSGGTFRIAGASAGGFIRALGAGSTRVSLSGLNPLTIEGYGLGHGVGLSQYGALGLANQGYDHLHVLGFYYPGTVLSLLAGHGTQAVLAGGVRLPTLGDTVLALTRGGMAQ